MMRYGNLFDDWSSDIRRRETDRLEREELEQEIERDLDIKSAIREVDREFPDPCFDNAMRVIIKRRDFFRNLKKTIPVIIVKLVLSALFLFFIGIKDYFILVMVSLLFAVIPVFSRGK
jgi:hypothetical protein